VWLVFGVRPSPFRSVDGTPQGVSFYGSSQLLDPATQRAIVKLCAFLEVAPPSRVRQGSVQCPLRDVQRTRQREGRSWPASADETFDMLSSMAEADPRLLDLMGAVGDDASRRLAWLAVRLQTNVLTAGSASKLRESADWFEGLMDRLSADKDAEGLAEGWQTSDGWVWMEGLEQAVSGTAACLLSGALFTVATLILLTNSLTIALATIASVAAVLVCFLGYLVQRGYRLGVGEAISVTIFVGLACDYCVHVMQVHRVVRHAPRGAEDQLRHILCHAAPSLYGAALTTVGSCLPLLGCSLLAFQEMGEFITVCTVTSLAVATTLLSPGLCIAEECHGRARTEAKIERL